MPIYRLQSAFALDSALPRDRMVITPHFNQQAGGDPQGLCDDLAAALSDWWVVQGEVTVTAYDAQGTVPVYPVGQAVQNPGASVESPCAREMAVCLSFYGERNIPRHRGRVYVPMPVIMSGTTGTGLGVRPNVATRTKAGDLAQIFSDLGDITTDWSVYSRADDVAYGVTNWWVDDEWDTQRSRGLRSTTRTAGTVSDG